MSFRFSCSAVDGDLYTVHAHIFSPSARLARPGFMWFVWDHPLPVVWRGQGLWCLILWLTHLEDAKFSHLSFWHNENCRSKLLLSYVDTQERHWVVNSVFQDSVFPFLKVIFYYCFNRHRKNREAASELLMRLKDNRDLQKFLQDCQEVCLPSAPPSLSSKESESIWQKSPWDYKINWGPEIHF